MDKQAYISTVAVIFLLVAIVHALRLYYGWGGVIGGWELPMWLSWAGLILAGYLAWQGFKFKK